MASSTMLSVDFKSAGCALSRHTPSTAVACFSTHRSKYHPNDLAVRARMLRTEETCGALSSISSGVGMVSNFKLDFVVTSATRDWCTGSVPPIKYRRDTDSSLFWHNRKLAVQIIELKHPFHSKFRRCTGRLFKPVASPGARAEQRFLEASTDVTRESAEPAASLTSDDLNAGVAGTSDRDGESKQSPIGVFPGGVRRAEVRIPGLVTRLQVMEVLDGKGLEGFLDVLSSVVAEGFTMVILESGVDGEGGARLYEAACLLKSVLRGRAALVVAERVDIAAAAGVDGVVLSDEGLPTVVARKMMQNALSEAAVLPLVARTVSSTQSAKAATALEGADLLLLQCPVVGDVSTYVRSICSEVSIPVFVDVSTTLSCLDDMNVGVASELLQAGASGFITGGKTWIEGVSVPDTVARLTSVMSETLKQSSRSMETPSSMAHPQVVYKESISLEESSPVNGVSLDVSLDLDKMAKLILEEERQLLTTMIDFMGAASPEMEEISLLVDALKQLDELFLLVIVGEFNSGKSSVINALLGERFLKEGVLPTTNEITVLRHSGEGREGGERSEKHPDGHFLRFLPTELLKQMNLVDTPGTNVILQRQQRLTEEFVPRADLVLFVLSVDRPLTESEVTFLRYIRQWGKKIVFILNKSDVLPDLAELEEVLHFVKENAQSLLSVDEASVYPVSARLALVAKQAAKKEDGTLDKDLLAADSSWRRSGFEKLENFIFSFLGGSTDAGAERLRLKLETPLGIGVALLNASEKQLAANILKAESDLKVLTRIEEQLIQYQDAVQGDATLQRQRAGLMIAGAKSRAEKLVDSILRLSNIDAILKYLLGADGAQTLPVSRGFDQQVMGSSKIDIERILEEHGSWMAANASRQLDIYRELVKSRWPEVSPCSESESLTELQRSDKLKEEQRRNSSNSFAVVQAFDVKAAEILLEQEIREAVLSTFAGLGAAGLSASVLTSVLPTTLEDLVALGICTAGGFAGVRNLPTKRQDIKRKISRVADNLALQLEQAMEADLLQNLEQLRAAIQTLTTPYRQAAEAERSRVLGLQSQLKGLDNQLRILKEKVQNLGM
ncbi:hypothetical protein R1sor_016896 [Riccia sorocarpa]|uniref:G domain-containing protein n=1 Tax=Riccia sorocarpa TaxID=122646 RepID=A0ABD3HGD6_9MARC